MEEKKTTIQCRPVMFNRTFYYDESFVSPQFNVVANSYIWLQSTWNVTSVTEETNFIFLNFHLLLFQYLFIFIYLAVPDLSCGSWGVLSLLQQVDLFFFQLLHVGSSSLTRN